MLRRGKGSNLEKYLTTSAYISGVLTPRIQTSAYGKCVVADYNNVTKDRCLTEFMRLQQCYTVSGLQLSADGTLAYNACVSVGGGEKTLDYSLVCICDSEGLGRIQSTP